MKVTIIIPTYNEALMLSRLHERLITAGLENIELILVDGGSTDGTVEMAEELGFKVEKCVCSRATQLNTGAALAKHDILYFVHADTLPPLGYLEDGLAALNAGFNAACYRSKFDSSKNILRLNAFFTRFNWLVSRGGDQSLFIRKSTFNELGKFDDKHVIMEEYPLIERLMEQKTLYVIPKTILISTRKYNNRSWFKVSRANYTAFKLYKKGTDTQKIRAVYNEKLNN